MLRQTSASGRVLIGPQYGIGDPKVRSSGVVADREHVERCAARVCFEVERVNRASGCFWPSASVSGTGLT
jgi:hypothetical protein